MQIFLGLRQKAVTILALGMVISATGCQPATTLESRLNHAISSQNLEFCQAEFSNQNLAQRVCKNWLRLAKLGSVEISAVEKLESPKLETGNPENSVLETSYLPDASSENSDNLEPKTYYLRTKYTEDEGFFTEKIQFRLQSGKIQEISTPASYWLADLEISEVHADILLNASPKWLSAWEQVRKYYELAVWRKLKQPKVTLIFPKSLAAFQELTAITQSADFGASTIPSQDGKTWRIVINPLADNSDLTAAKALLAHEFAHVVLAPYDKAKTLSEMEGFAEFQSWQIAPSYRLAAQQRLASNRQKLAINTDETPQTSDFIQRPRWAYDQSAALVDRQVQEKGLEEVLTDYCLGNFSLGSQK